MSNLFWINPFYEETSPEPILREAFNWRTNGIFAAMEDSGIELPWGSGDATILDLAYFGNHSGGKFCSPVVKLVLQTEDLVDEDGVINSTGTQMLASILLTKYLENWKRLWETNVVVYNPIHNYDMTEERDLTTTEDEEVVTDGTLARTGTDTTEHGMVETIGHGRTNEEMTYRYGINTNTSDPKPSDKVNTTEGGTTTTTDSGNDVLRRNLQDKNDVTETKDNDGTEHEEIHRLGNIGVTTSQQMLQAERDLWKWNYFDQIFSDLDRELALAFYDPCRV